MSLCNCYTWGVCLIHVLFIYFFICLLLTLKIILIIQPNGQIFQFVFLINTYPTKYLIFKSKLNEKKNTLEISKY